MIFTDRQVEELLKILDFHHSFFIATNLGADILSQQDRNLLSAFGIDTSVLTRDLPLFDKMYLFGKLTSILSDKQAKTLNFDDFTKYIHSGQYIPLSKREKIELELAKKKSYTYLKGLRQRANSDVENIILDEETKRKRYEDTIKTEIERGVADRKSVQSIVSEIGHKMNEWQHDWGRIVETESNNLFNEARAISYAEKDGVDAEVYKETYPGACRHCIQLHLTNGIGSKPIVYKLSTLVKNGSNVGKKVADWKVTVGSVHCYCRCLLCRKPKEYVWNEDKQDFVLPQNWERKVERKSKIHIQVGDKKFDI